MNYFLEDDVVELYTETVKHVFEKTYDTDLIELYPQHSSVIYARNDEQMFALKYDENFIGKMLKNDPIEIDSIEKLQPNWYYTYDLDINDYLAIPVPTYTKDISHITEEDCYLFGAMIANPYMRHLMKIESGSRLVSEMMYTIYVRPFQYEQFDKYFKERNIKIFHSFHEEKNVHVFQWSRCNQRPPFRYSDFYDSTDDYRIGYRILNLSLEKIRQVLKGFLDTCANIEKDIRFELVCNHLRLEDCKFYQTLYYLFLRAGIFLDEAWKPLGSGEFGHFTCIVDITPTVCELMGIEYDGRPVEYFEYKTADSKILFTQIQWKDYYDGFFGTIYDVSLRDNHNYLTSTGLFRSEA